jgi:hypothetical protein
MRVILDLDEVDLGKLQFKANTEKRSRKNYMEIILQNAANGNIPIVERQSAVYDAPKLPKNYIADEPPKVELPKEPIDHFEKAVYDASQARTFDELEKVMLDVRKNQFISKPQKIQIEQFATHLQQEKGFYPNG